MSESNRSTLLAAANDRACSREQLVAAHARACAAMASAPPSAAGYRVYWASAGTVGWHDLAVDGSHAILGRHSACDGVLAGEPSLSLRHLLATTVTLADGVALRLLDLQTQVPLFLGDDVPRRSLVACGPVAASLGDLVIGGVPIEETADGPRLVLAPLPPPRITDAQEVPRSVARQGVTSMPPPRSILELRRPAPAAASRAPRAAQTMRLTLMRGGELATIDVDRAELAQGVMLGRARRCHTHGLSAVLSESISRSHVLLLQGHGESGVLEVFDLCSTQGTFARERRVRRISVRSAEATFTMGSLDAVVVHVERP